MQLSLNITQMTLKVWLPHLTALISTKLSVVLNLLPSFPVSHSVLAERLLQWEVLACNLCSVLETSLFFLFWLRAFCNGRPLWRGLKGLKGAGHLKTPEKAEAFFLSGSPHRTVGVTPVVNFTTLHSRCPHSAAPLHRRPAASSPTCGCFHTNAAPNAKLLPWGWLP